MNAVLVDTDVFSYLIKDKHPLADVYRAHIKNKTVALSFVTVGELLAWSKKRAWSRKKIAALDQRLDGGFPRIVHDQVLTHAQQLLGHGEAHVADANNPDASFHCHD